MDMSTGEHADCSSWCHLKADSGAVPGVGQDGIGLVDLKKEDPTRSSGLN